MARGIHNLASPLAQEFDVGGDDDPGGETLYSNDDVDAIVAAPDASMEERRGLLLSMRDDLIARGGMDLSGETDELVARIEDALRLLDAPAAGLGTASAYGMDPQTRHDQPDEDYDRADAFERGEDDD